MSSPVNPYDGMLREVRLGHARLLVETLESAQKYLAANLKAAKLNLKQLEEADPRQLELGVR